jgi:hypothetical protein
LYSIDWYLACFLVSPSCFFAPGRERCPDMVIKIYARSISSRIVNSARQTLCIPHSLQPLIPICGPSLCAALRLLQLLRQLVDLTQERLIGRDRITLQLLHQMIDRVCARQLLTLRRLDARHLELQEELGLPDGEVAARAAQAGLRREVHVERFLELRQVAVLEGLGGLECVEGELKRCFAGVGEVDAREGGDGVDEEVGDVAD